MTLREQRRVMILTALRERRLIARQAAQVLGVSLRQIRRLVATFRRRGPAALAHGNRGRPPHNRLPRRLQRQVVRFARTTYAGSAPILPLGLGYVEGVTHDYIRRGTTTLFATLNIASGQVLT